MVTKEKLEEMLQHLSKQEEELFAMLNKIAGSKETINHLLGLFDQPEGE